MDHHCVAVQQVLRRLGTGALGGGPVLLPIPHGKKGPCFDGWQKVTRADFDCADFTVNFSRDNPSPAAERVITRTVRYADLFHGANIGVLQGSPSGGLCSIDVDDEAAAAALLELNPGLLATLRTRGARGCNLWLWVEGECPRLHKDICWRTPDGAPDKSRPVGEWRSTGGQTVIFGRHPRGMDYQWLVDAEPVRIRFDEILWPEAWHLPWKAETQLKPGASDPTLALAPLAAAEAELAETYGAPFHVSKTGGLDLNPPYWAAALAKRENVIHAAEECRFYRYEPARGLWVIESEDKLRWRAGEMLQEVAKQTGREQLTFKRTANGLNALVLLARGAVETREAFRRPIDPQTGLPRLFLHLQNGMAVMDGDELRLEDFAPAFMSRNQLAVALDEDAQCPRFLGELLETALEPEDIDLLQRWAGMLVLGVNLAQRIMILSGTSGGGKSTLLNVIAHIIGRANVGELRTAHLHERFEVFRLVGRTLLVGADVPGDFLESDGAYVLKALVGGDLLDAEPKQGNQVVQIRGEFNVAVLSNTRLRVRLDGDVEAWRRRLMIVPYARPRVKNPDPRFAAKLLVSEAPGILNWCLAGARKLVGELRDHGDILMTARQKRRVDSLLAESDSLREFARARLVRAEKRSITAEKLNSAYVDFCEEMGWTPQSGRIVERCLPDVLSELFRATRNNHVRGADGKDKRGYMGVALANESLELSKAAEVGDAY